MPYSIPLDSVSHIVIFPFVFKLGTVHANYSQSTLTPFFLQFCQIWQDVVAIDTTVSEEVEQGQGAMKAGHVHRFGHIEPGYVWLELWDCLWIFSFHLTQKGENGALPCPPLIR